MACTDWVTVGAVFVIVFMARLYMKGAYNK